jgi:hypothetical protein
MSTSIEPWQPLLDTLATLPPGWPGSPWSWDGRFKCVTSSFNKAIGDRVRAATVEALPGEWTAATIDSAADPIRALANRFGGLREGQLFLAGESVAGMRLFALWWPWGDGSTISVRIGIANSDRPTELYPLVRALFGIA